MFPFCSLALFSCLICSLRFGTAEVTCAFCTFPTPVQPGGDRSNAQRGPSLNDPPSTEFQLLDLVLGLNGAGEAGEFASGAPNSPAETEKVRKKEPRRKRSAVTGEFGVNARSSDSPESSEALLLDGQKLKRNREDARVSGSRSEEPKVSSSTFALAGDYAHNHASVYWTGQNSSVSPMHAVLSVCPSVFL